MHLKADRLAPQIKTAFASSSKIKKPIYTSTNTLKSRLKTSVNNFEKIKEDEQNAVF